MAYTPYTVTTHLLGPERGGLRFDYRRVKHPYADKFMLAGGHNAPVTYALWMIMGEALARKYAKTGDSRYYVDPRQGDDVHRRPWLPQGYRRFEDPAAGKQS